MKYTEETAQLLKELYDTPIQPGLYFSKCKMCGYLVVEGHRYVNQPITDAMHHDCFIIDMSEKMRDLFMCLYKTQQVSSTQIEVNDSIFQRLVDKALNFFPYQHNFFLTGKVTKDRIIISDFFDVPFLKYEMPEGEFSRWDIDNSKETKKKYLEILEKKELIGYVHSHDGNGISLSDLFYDNLYLHFVPEEFHRNFQVRCQLDMFYPTLKHLVLLNRKRFEEKKEKSPIVADSHPLVVPEGIHYLPTKYFYRYLKPETVEDKKIIQTARKLAKTTILSDPEKFFGAYVTLLEDLKTLKPKEINHMFSEFDRLASKGMLPMNEIENSRLVNFVKGKVKQLPVIIKKD